MVLDSYFPILEDTSNERGEDVIGSYFNLGFQQLLCQGKDYVDAPILVIWDKLLQLLKGKEKEVATVLDIV